MPKSGLADGRKKALPDQIGDHSAPFMAAPERFMAMTLTWSPVDVTSIPKIMDLWGGEYEPGQAAARSKIAA